MKKGRVKESRQVGFTIVELIVSMIVVGILIVGLNSIYMAHMIQSHRARNLVIVNSFVENKIESLRSAGFLSISDGTSNISTELPTDLGAPHSATMQITSPVSGIKKVALSITYNDGGGQRTYDYQTYIGELGVGQY